MERKKEVLQKKKQLERCQHKFFWHMFKAGRGEAPFPPGSPSGSSQAPLLCFPGVGGLLSFLVESWSFLPSPSSKTSASLGKQPLPPEATSQGNRCSLLTAPSVQELLHKSRRQNAVDTPVHRSPLAGASDKYLLWLNSK